MKVKFNEIANFVAGQSPKSEYYSNDKGTPFLQGNRTFGIFYPEIDTYTTKVTKMANEGDILMSVRAPVGDLNFAPMPLCIGRGLASITAKDGDNAFLFYALKHNIHTLLNQSNGTTYDSVTGDIVKDLDMIIPDSVDERKKISALLYEMDKKIENNNKINAELESMAKTIYDYWFLQFEFPNEDGKPYKSSGGKMVWNEELKREIPEGWEVFAYKEMFKFNKGKIPDELSDVQYGKLNTPYITIDAANGGLVQYCSSEQMIYCNGETIMVMDGAASGDVYVGNVGVLGSTFAMLSPISTKVSNSFIYWVLKSNTEIYKKANTGSTVPHANRKYIESMQIALPKNTKELTKIFNDIQEKINHNRKENQELTSLRDFLLPMLMNGQVGFKK